MNPIKRDELWFMLIVSAVLAASLVSYAIDTSYGLGYAFLTIMLICLGKIVGIIKADK